MEYYLASYQQKIDIKSLSAQKIPKKSEKREDCAVGDSPYMGPGSSGRRQLSINEVSIVGGSTDDGRQLRRRQANASSSSRTWRLI
jgi:hypothetical protein